MFDLTGITEQGKQLNESFQQIIALLTQIRDDQRQFMEEQRTFIKNNNQNSKSTTQEIDVTMLLWGQQS